jgi:XRE family transcriptional regulator, regulator of sulfur utilization
MARYKKLGAKIKQLRKELDLTQEDLAEKAKLDSRTIRAIEHGETNPTFKTLSKLAKVLKINEIDLM